ncbi:MAG TPA: ORF6N domain-containing protein [Bacteroidetes bacterium]|nr:ORF6N domain-containing protein [Bacteroidota bacterium]
MEKIYVIRSKKVMLDRDLAELYEVVTRRLKEQVRRNMDRFPEDFMFELTEKEHQQLKEQFGKRNRGSHSKYPPFAFTEYGVLMLASVLNSERAIQVNIQIVRIFTKMREMLLTHKDIIDRLDQIEHTLSGHDEKITLIFEYLKQLEKDKQGELEQKNRPRIGYKQGKKK